MSKFLKIMIVLLTVTTMVTPVMAEDMLSLGGQMRVGIWSLDSNTDTDNDTDTYAEQRLRIGGKFSVSEGVSVTFRTDFSEQSWGSNPSLGRTPWQLDRAHLDIDKGIFHLKAGQLYYGIAGQFAVDTETTGAVLDMNLGAAKIQFAYLLPDNNGTGADDTLIVLNASHKTDSYSGNVFVANSRNRSALADATDPDPDVTLTSGEDVYLYGFGATFNLNAVKLETGLSVFDGDFLKAADVDAMGTQFNLKGTFAASETVSVGGTFYYAQAANDDEAQVTYLGNGFNGYDVTNYGSLENENLFDYANRVYDFTGEFSGVIGGQVFASVKTSADLTLYGSLAYLTPEDDNNTGVDSDIALNVSMAYKIMDNVSMAAQVQYIDRDDNAGTDATTAFGTRLYVNF